MQEELTMGLSEQAKANKAAYIERYKKEHYVFFSIKCNKANDKDIIDYLETVPNKSEAIKAGLRKLIADGNA